MRKNKAAMIRRRQCLLIVLAFALSALALWTGVIGFGHDPEAGSMPDVPSVTDPISTPTTEATSAATVETAAGTAVETTAGTVAQAVDEPAMQQIPEDLPADESEPDPAMNTTEPIAASATEATEEPTAETALQAVGKPEMQEIQEDIPADAAEQDSAANPPETTAAFPAQTASEAAEQTNSTDFSTDAAATDAPEQDAAPGHGFRIAMRIACYFFTTAAGVDILLLVMLRKNVRKYEEKSANAGVSHLPARVDPIPITRKTMEQPLYPIPGISLGKIHDVGKRDYQQDSFGQIPVLQDTGVLAVLADGMGGLSGGEKVSRKIIMEALDYGAAFQAGQLPNALTDMVAGINDAVNQMLGPTGLYTSGSTVVSALIADGALRWISVGDSRVYLYRDGQLNQLSRDHDLMQDWMGDILEGKRSMADAMNDPDGRKLTSFIGMGELRHVDYNHLPIPLLPGDRVLLMSDGIYGTVSDTEMETILRASGNVQEAASGIRQKIADASLPYQDNYTLVILGYDPQNPHGDRT